MSSNPPPIPPPGNPPVVYPAAFPPPNALDLPPPRTGGGRVWLTLFLVGSLILNIILCAGLTFGSLGLGDAGHVTLPEKFIAGDSAAHDKIAVIRVEGAIMEGFLGHVHKQIDQAARDQAVKAVVVRIESPGGSITASDDLLHRLELLRDGATPKYVGKTSPKPLVVSMGSVAASGGYYIAMAARQSQGGPQRKIFAERSTITGSIGVYASLPNAKGTADKIGFKMDMIKAGDIKGAGSLFHDLSPQERQPWQDMVEAAYRQFIEVVETGRPALAGKLEQPLFDPKPVGKFDDKGNRIGDGDVKYTRKRADGGIFTSKEAMQNGLIDAIGPIEEAVTEVAQQAGLRDWKAVRYDRPPTLWTAIVGESKAPTDPLATIDLTPRLWYLLPHAEGAARMQR